MTDTLNKREREVLLQIIKKHAMGDPGADVTFRYPDEIIESLRKKGVLGELSFILTQAGKDLITLKRQRRSGSSTP